MKRTVATFFLIFFHVFFMLGKPRKDNLRTDSISLGKTWTELYKKLKNKKISVKIFKFDDQTIVATTTERTQREFKLKHFIIFNDTIFKILTVLDNTYFDDTTKNVIVENIELSSIRLNFESYYKKTYKSQPNYASIPMSFFDFGFNFSKANGSTVPPHYFYNEYFLLKSLSYTSLDILNLLTSFGLKKRMLGLLLFDNKKHFDINEIYTKMFNRMDKVPYWYGCEPGPDITIIEIIEGLKYY